MTIRDDDTLVKQPAQQQEPVTVLPDGSAFAVMSYPLPKDHWLYADRQYNDGEYEPVELGKPVLTHELRDAVVSAVRYAIRAATNCGKEVDFDPDALVQNAVYALCGPFTSPQPAQQHDYWQEEARRYAQNADFWRGKYEAATAQQQEPVAWMYQCSADSSGPVLMQHKRDWAESGSGLWTETPLYTSQPASKPWVGLTNEEKERIRNTWGLRTYKAIEDTEAELREKNQ